MVKHIYDISNIINKLRLIQSLLFSYPDTEEKNLLAAHADAK